jgi:hypothetical protein
MSKYILNLSTIQQGHKIQLIKEVREKWDDSAEVGDKVAFFEDEDGRIIIEPTGRPGDESE